MSQTDSKGHVPTWIDRWLLVKYKKYPSTTEIPTTVSSIMMRRVHDRARVHASFIIMFVAGVAMFGNALIGKRQARDGMSMEKRIQMDQLAYNKKKEAELARAAAKTE